LTVAEHDPYDQWMTPFFRFRPFASGWPRLLNSELQLCIRFMAKWVPVIGDLGDILNKPSPLYNYRSSKISYDVKID